MRERPNSSARRIRRSGVRVSLGSWTAYAAPTGETDCALIVALGRSAGNAVARSRARRIARDVFTRVSANLEFSFLLMARDDIRTQSRRSIRSALQRLMTRAIQVSTERCSQQEEQRE